MWKIWARWLSKKLVHLLSTILSSFLTDNQGSESWNWTTWCINQREWKHRWWSHWFYVGTLSQVKTGVSWILQTRHNASDRPSSFSNERPQSYMVPDASLLDDQTQSLSMLRKHAWKGQYVYTALISGQFYKLTQVYTLLRPGPFCRLT